MPLLKVLPVEQLPPARRSAIHPDTLAAAERIMNDVRARGMPAVLEHARRFGDLAEGGDVIFPREQLTEALRLLDPESRAVLERTAGRIRDFAEAQRDCLLEMDRAVQGGRAGHTLSPVVRAGCYAPGGRFPLPSSVLMTAITARAAGVAEVWVASPRPTLATLAAAALAGCDHVLAVGGVQAIGALAYGAGPVPACDIIVGPGNKFVTAAKHIASRVCGIDMLAGPSEVLIIADDSADPKLVAADLLAQAEHDADAVPMLVSTDAGLIAATEQELERQLTTLPTAAIARDALRNGFAVLASDSGHAALISDAIAPEHLEIMTRDAEELAARVRHYGAVFIGALAAEVLGDYGAGPNHVLPTGGIARSCGGLSVLTFLRMRTWLRMDGGEAGAALGRDAAAMGRMEGLEGHARAAEARLG